MEIRALKRDGRFVVIAATACIALALWCTSCGGGGSTVVPVSTAGFSISSTAITFGTQAVGTTSASQSATLINVGNASLTFTSIEVTGANAGDFQLSNTCGASLAPQGQCTVGLTFTPSAAGNRTASVVFTDNASGSPQTVNVSGSGTSATVGVSSNLLTFGTQLLGTSATQQTVTVTNNGNGALSFTGIAVTGANLGDFPETTTCGSSLAAAASCTIGVTFTPVAIGSRSAAVTIADNAAGSPQTISLTGTGTNPVASLSSNALTFGNQNLGIASAPQSITLSNTGNAVLSITSIVAMGANAGDFNVTNTCGGSVAVGANCAINVTFDPASAGNRSAAVAITDNAAGSPQSITLSGVGVGSSAVGSLSSSSLGFGSQSLGTTSAALSVTLSNSGNAALVYTPPIPVTGPNAADFSESDNCGGSVAAGGSCTISVTFTPSGAGTRTGSVLLTSNASNSPQILSLSGTGTTSAVSLSSSAVTFTAQAVGTTSPAQAVTLTNTGGAALSIAGVGLLGNNAGDFGQSNNCGSSVAAGGTCTINVTFTPTAPGTRSATVAITDNAAGSPQIINLTGAGSGAALTLTVNSLTFASQFLGATSAAQPVTLSNTGTTALNISSLALSGANAGDYAQLNTCGSSLQAGYTCTVSVTFTPTATGTRAASLVITDNAAGSPQGVSLSGTGTGPVVGIAPGTVTFNGQLVGSTSPVQLVTVSNTGNGALTISGVQVGGANASDFLETNTCGSSVAAGANCTFSLTFSPSAPSSRTASLTIVDNALTSPQTVNITGTGTGPVANVPASSLTFANQNIGTTSGPQTVVLNNTGNAALLVSSVSFLGANPGDFAQMNTCGSSVAAGGACNINVTFTPTTGGTRTASLIVTDNSGNVAGTQQLVSVTGTANGPTASFNPPALTFGSQSQGTTSAAQSVTLTNTGSQTLVLTSVTLTGANASDFAQTGTTCGGVVTANSSCTISVTFTPSGSGSRTAALTFTDNAGSPQTVALTGSGLSGQVTLVPSSLTFPSQAVGVTSNAQSTMLTNTGTMNFTLTGISLVGADPGDFSETNGCPATLIPNASCTIIVKFTPVTTGVRQASLSFVDSLASSPQTVTLTGTGGGPTANLSSGSLTFAPQNLGATSTAQSVTLTNSGNAPLTITGISTVGANPGDYALTSTCGGSLAVNGSCTISLTFTPTAIGTRIASVNIADNAAGSPQSINLTGTGSGPIAGITTGTLTFNNQPLGVQSGAQVFTLSNSGNAPLQISGIGFSGANPGDFSDTTTCANTLAANANCSFSVTFTPSATGGRTATLTITDNSNDGAGTQQTVSLSGTGTGPSVNLAPGSLTFTSQTLGTNSAAQALTLTNTGNGVLTITSLALTGANAGDFSQTNTCGSSVASGGNCTINVTFAPTALGNRMAAISIVDNAAGSPQSVTVSGVGTASVAGLSVSSLSFTGQPVQTTSSAQTITLTNTGNAALTITSISASGANSGDFSQVNNCGSSVAAGANCTVSVTFTPSAVGNRAASIVFADTASGSPQSVTLTGLGAGPVASLTASSLTFSAQAVGSTSASQVVTVNNTGNTNLDVSAVVLSGVNSGDFAQTNTCGTAIAAGSSCAVTVTFSPSAPGSRSASITISDDAVGSPQVITLSGTGTGPVAGLSLPGLSFNSQSLGTTSVAQTLTLSNTGNASLTIASIVLSGTNSGDYSQTNNCGSAVAANGSCTISLTFTPSAPGARTATVTVTDNTNNVANSIQSASLTGTGTGPAVTLSPPTLTFASLTIGVTSPSQSVTLTNTGNASLTLSSFQVTGANSGDFSQSTTCPASLAAGVDCTVTVTFTPTAVGSRAASVSIVDNAAGSPQTIGLSGTGLGPLVSLSTPTLTFVPQSVGTTSASQIVTVNNTGNAPLNITAVGLTGANPGDFAQSSTCGSPVAAGSSCTISATFTPTAPGARAASITLTDNATGSPQSVGLTGTGSGPLAGLAGSSLTFASQNVGSTSASQTLTLSNTGNASLTVSSIALTGTNPGEFGISNNCAGSVAASGSCTISVTFTPTVFGTRTATVLVTDNTNNVANSTQSSTLSGTGAGAFVTLAPSSLSFGSQAEGVASSSQPVLLTNTGNATLTITSILVGGANAADFAPSNTCGGSVVAGGSCSISAIFTPSTTGAESASVNITDNAPGSPQSIGLSGTGTSGQISLSPPSLTFSSQNVGSTSLGQTITVTNTGNASFNISSVALTGVNAGDFSETTTCGGALAQTATCTVTVKFAPTAPLTRTATVSITDTLPGSPHTAGLTGTGTGPLASVTSGGLTYASQNVGSASAAQTFSLNNAGNATLTISNIGFTGANPGDFSQTNTCAGSVLASGSCTISVTFTPTAAGSRTATLSITDNNNNLVGSLQSVGLTGTGSAPTASLTLSTLTFVSQNLSTTSTAQTVTLNNTGNAALLISGVGFTGANSGDFGQTNNCGGSVAAGGSCTLSVTFTPTAIGSRTASLNITDNTNDVAGSQQTVTVSGTGSGATVTLNPGSLTFASQGQGTASPSQGILVTNTGNANLTFSSITVTGTNAGDFTQTNTCASPIAPNGTCTISVTFTPGGILSRTASVNIADNVSGSPQVVTLNGSGSAPIAGATTSSLTFVNQSVGTTSTAQMFTLNNSGNASLIIASMVFSGANAGDFGQTNTCAGSVAAGGSCTISVTFAPNAEGSRAATLTLTDNSNNAAGSQQAITLSGTGTAPLAGVAPGSLTFASQTLNTTSTSQTFTLSNTGNAPLLISTIGFTGANPTDFGQTNNCAASVPAAGSCTFTVTFTPTAIGGRAANLVITDNTNNVLGSQQSVSLTGTGTSPIVTLNSSTLSFLPQTQGTTSATQSVMLSNTGNATLTITSMTVGGANPGDFSVTNTCGSTVLASGSCMINVTFTPTAILGRAASISIADNAPASPQVIMLTGTGTASIVTLGTGTITFVTPQPELTSSPSQAVNLTNTGNQSLTITSISVTGANAGDFSQTNTCPVFPATLASSGFCTITVVFTPTASGSRTAAVTISDNATAGSPQAVSLAGTGVLGSVGLSASILPYGSQAVASTSAAQSVVLTNGGTSALTITSILIAGANPGDFAISSNNCPGSLAVNATCTVGVTFTPTTSGSRAAALNFTDSASNSPQTVSLTGTGTAPEAGLSPNTFIFINTPTATPSASQTFTLSNTGNATLNIGSITFTGTNPTDFSEVTTCLATLASNSSCTIAITFTPGASAARSGNLVVTDNNNNVANSTQTSTLSGTGLHDVVLTWTASPTSGISGYDIYRGTSPGGEGATPINSSPVSVLTYADTNVTIGTQYYYVVKAVSSNGLLFSPASNEANATVP